VDIPNDGEYARRGFTQYIHERLGGLEPVILKPGDKNPLDQIGHEIERDDFPGFYAQHDKVYRFMWMLPGVDMTEMANIRGKSEIFRLAGPVRYIGAEKVQWDIANLRAGLAGRDVSDAFITAVTPTTERRDLDVDKFYPSQDAYLEALGDALHE